MAVPHLLHCSHSIFSLSQRWIRQKTTTVTGGLVGSMAFPVREGEYCYIIQYNIQCVTLDSV